MKFPSEEFYDGSLRIASDMNCRILQQQPSNLSIWARRSDPIKFIDVVHGVQRTRTVATADSSQRSKYNMKEVEEVVSRSFFVFLSSSSYQNLSFCILIYGLQ